MAEFADGPPRTRAHRRLDLDRKSARARYFADQLAARVVGQEDAIRAFANLYEMFMAGMNQPRRPVGALLFLGPTGSGKTRVVEAAAEVLFGDPRALIKVDCGELQHAHEIARLIGPPPGYVGHKDTKPLLTQQNLDAHQTPEHRLSIVLFDEIEKASEALWQLLLGMLDRATLTLGDNSQVDFTRTIIVMTSNLGAAEMGDAANGGLGFAPVADDARRMKRTIQRAGLEAARRRFSPEFMNRIDRTVVFEALGSEALRRILDLELGFVQKRLFAAKGTRFRFHCTDAAKAFLLEEGVDQRYGARHLKRAIERLLVLPLSTLVASEQVRSGDVVEVDFDEEARELVFAHHSSGEPVPPPETEMAEEIRIATGAAAVSVEEAQAATAIAVATAAALTGVILELMKERAPRTLR